MIDKILDEEVEKYVQKEFIIVDSKMSVVDAVRIMREKKIDCVIVYEDNKPVGMLTLRDIVYKVLAENRDPSKTRIGDVASKPLIYVLPDTKVRDALKIMMEKDIRRLPVIDRDKIIGVLVLRMVVGNLAERSILILDLEPPEGYKCPYCGSVFKTSDELSKHIDRVHIGHGLLEGITRKE
ncbi:MAG: CBS domain-containing protein [Nitrososphaerota archaeon]